MASLLASTTLQTITVFASSVEHFRLPIRPCETFTIPYAQITTAVPFCAPTTTPAATPPATTLPPSPAVPASPIDPTQTIGPACSNSHWLKVGLPLTLVAVIVVVGFLVYRFAVNKQYDKLYPNRIRNVFWNPPVRERIVYRYVPVTEPCEGAMRMQAEETARSTRAEEALKMQAEEAAKKNPAKAARARGKGTVRPVASEEPTLPEPAVTKSARTMSEPESPGGTTGIQWGNINWGNDNNV